MCNDQKKRPGQWTNLNSITVHTSSDDDSKGVTWVELVKPDGVLRFTVPTNNIKVKAGERVSLKFDGHRHFYH